MELSPRLKGLVASATSMKKTFRELNDEDKGELGNMRKAEMLETSRLTLALTASVILIGFAAGCGGDDSTSNSASTDSNEREMKVTVDEDSSGPDQTDLLRQIGDANQASEPAFYKLIAAGKSGDPARLEAAIDTASSHLEKSRSLINQLTREDLKQAVLRMWRPSSDLVAAYSDALEASQAGDQAAYEQAGKEIIKAVRATQALLKTNPMEGVGMSQEEVDAFSGR